MKMEKKIKIGIIGAGIQGVCSALFLQKKGFSVTLFDREDPERHLAADAVRGRVVDSLRHRDARLVVQARSLTLFFTISNFLVRDALRQRVHLHRDAFRARADELALAHLLGQEALPGVGGGHVPRRRLDIDLLRRRQCPDDGRDAAGPRREGRGGERGRKECEDATHASRNAVARCKRCEKALVWLCGLRTAALAYGREAHCTQRLMRLR